jgi:protocatechuate 3,4-dioxygenase beta subunit
MTHRFGRREFLGASAVLLLSRVERAHAQGGGPRPTPACGEHGVTHPQTPGPYFKPQSPPRASLLEPGMPGPRIVVEGTVLGRDCKPVPRALLDFWQADAGGEYDNAGFRLRGHQFTDAAGRYRLESVVPGIYPGRTRHFHVNVQAPGGRMLTTQLYFPGEPLNQRDGLFDRDLVMKVREADGGKLAAFDFLL